MEFLSSIDNRLAVAQLYQFLLRKESFVPAKAGTEQQVHFVNQRIKQFLTTELQSLLGMVPAEPAPPKDEAVLGPDDISILKAFTGSIKDKLDPTHGDEQGSDTPLDPPTRPITKKSPKKDTKRSKAQTADPVQRPPSKKVSELLVHPLKKGAFEKEVDYGGERVVRLFSEQMNPSTGELEEVDVTGVVYGRNYNLAVNPMTGRLVVQDAQKQIKIPARIPPANSAQQEQFAQHAASGVRFVNSSDNSEAKDDAFSKILRGALK